MTAVEAPPSERRRGHITVDDVRRDVESVAEDAGMTYDEFMQAGEDDDLRDHGLRSLWLAVRPILRGR